MALAGDAGRIEAVLKENPCICKGFSGALGRLEPATFPIRRQTLYPAKLQACEGCI
jgi:hypothetical protein